mmetsp:Transcript_12002/g.28547  ORF Transcript_12002/g.28547 Transcript_12002/m.28547 type:complete len:282 (+) Transcript_12002:42-887(+)
MAVSRGVDFKHLEQEALHAGNLRRKCKGTCGPSWIDVNAVIVHNFLCFPGRNGGRIEALCLVGSSVEVHPKSPGQFSIRWPATPEVCFNVDSGERALWVQKVQDAGKTLPDCAKIQQEKDAISQELAYIKRTSAEEVAAQEGLKRSMNELNSRLQDETAKLQECQRSLDQLQHELRASEQANNDAKRLQTVVSEYRDLLAKSRAEAEELRSRCMSSSSSSTAQFRLERELRESQSALKQERMRTQLLMKVLAAMKQRLSSHFPSFDQFDLGQAAFGPSPRA